MIERINWEQIRMICVSGISPILGYFTPTKGFILALILAFAFNVWAGMRADGVVLVTCKNFSFSKFKNAIWEMILYLLVMEIIFAIMKACGDDSAAILAVKSLTYVFVYVYIQNALKNLVSAYPGRMALRVIYHVVRLEFTRALPSHIKPIMERIEEEQQRKEEKKSKKKKEE